MACSTSHRVLQTFIWSTVLYVLVVAGPATTCITGETCGDTQILHQGFFGGTGAAGLQALAGECNATQRTTRRTAHIAPVFVVYPRCRWKRTRGTEPPCYEVCTVFVCTAVVGLHMPRTHCPPTSPRTKQKKVRVATPAGLPPGQPPSKSQAVH